MKLMRRPLVLGILALCFSLFSCGGDDSPAGPELPTVSINTPGGGSVVSGTIDIAATAGHADRVIFSVDGTEVGRDETSPYMAAWNSASVGDGAHAVKATAEGGGGSAEDEISVTVNNTNPPPPVTVTVAPSTAEVRVGQMQQFTATVIGSGNTSVIWSIDETGRGSISTSGLYTAPGSVPGSPTATIRARSVADPSKSGTAALTIAAATGFAIQEKRLIAEAFGAGTDISIAAGQGVDLGVEAVFVASGQNGNQLTLTGTLTQAAPGSEVFNYSSGPGDRMVVAFSDGTTVQLIFTSFQGFTGGTWEDFRNTHSNLDFRVLPGDGGDLRIQSSSGPPTGGHRLFQRTLTGTAQFMGAPVTVNLTHSGDVFFDIGLGAGIEYDSQEQTSGTITSSAGATQVDAGYRYHLVSFDRFAENVFRAVETSAAIGGNTFRFQDVFVRSSFLDSRVSEPDFWLAQGTLTRNGATVGTVQFDSEVIDGASFPGPKPVVALTEGGTIPLGAGFQLIPRSSRSPGARRS